MPLPQRKPKESHDEFIERCMSDATMVEEFPDAAQRRAVCERQARMRTQAHLNLVCDPSSITIEAAEEGQDGKPKLPRFTMVAYTGGPMRVFGWSYPVIVDLAGLAIPSQNRPIRFGHDMASGVGHTDSIRVENGQLVATGVVSRNTEIAREIVASAKNGFPWQASIGAQVEEYEFVKKDQTVSVNGRQFSGPVNVVRKATLGEISFVDLGADGATSVQVTANFYPQKESRTMEQDKQTQEKTLEAKGQLEQVAGSASLSNEPPKANETTVQTQSNSGAADLAAEAARIAAIRSLYGEEHSELCAKAIEEGWDVRRAGLELVRAKRPAAPRIAVTGDGRDRLQEVLASAIAARGGVAPEPTLRAEAERWRMAPLTAIARLCCAQAGVSISPQASNTELVQAAFSTRLFPNVLKDAAQKISLDGYQAVDKASLKVARVLEAVDFKPHTLVRLTGQYRLEKVAPDGELPHAQLTDQGYTIKVDTYGRLVGLTRQDIINDDLGAFVEIPRQIGRGAALALESAFWTMVEGANGAFFTAGNNNVISGASSAFGIAGLNAAIAKLRKQKDEAGNPIKARPRYVAVPPDLEADATQIYTSNVLLAAGSTDKVIGANNPHVNKYEPVVSEYLTGSGASSVWYLTADPADVPAFGVAFLRGQQAPTIEEADPDPKYLGTLWRGYFDFGVALLDPRGAVRANGS